MPQTPPTENDPHDAPAGLPSLDGHLEPGNNTIAATPSTRGEVALHLASELFRRGRSEE